LHERSGIGQPAVNTKNLNPVASIRTGDGNHVNNLRRNSTQDGKHQIVSRRGKREPDERCRGV
jgi:hypothetical protein